MENINRTKSSKSKITSHQGNDNEAVSIEKISKDKADCHTSSCAIDRELLSMKTKKKKKKKKKLIYTTMRVC